MSLNSSHIDNLIQWREKLESEGLSIDAITPLPETEGHGPRWRVLISDEDNTYSGIAARPSDAIYKAWHLAHGDEEPPF